MVQCKNCGSKFSWKEIFIANWLYKTIQCGNCGNYSKITFASRGIVTCLTVVPILVFGWFLSPFENSIITGLIAIAIGIGCSLFTPFLVKYETVEQEAS